MPTLRPWSEPDSWLLSRANTAEMTEFLGGPETPAALDRRHARYLDHTTPGAMFVIVLDTGDVAGSIGYWEHAEPDGTVWETGWSVLPEHQGRGIAGAAIHALVARVAAAGTHSTLHAYPAVANLASNALCRKTGFTLLGPRSFEYPKGHWMSCNDWSRTLG